MFSIQFRTSATQLDQKFSFLQCLIFSPRHWASKVFGKMPGTKPSLPGDDICEKLVLQIAIKYGKKLEKLVSRILFGFSYLFIIYLSHYFHMFDTFEQFNSAMHHEVAHGTSFTTSSRRLSSFGPIGPHMLYMVNAQMGQQVLT